jgi:hypothetical protein
VGSRGPGGPNFPFCLILLAVVCVSPCHCVAQSETGHCNYLREQYLTAVLETETHHPNESDFGTKDWDQEIARWREEWQKVIETGRQYLGECPSVSKSTSTDVLNSIAEGLDHLGQREDAVPILRRCVAADPDKSQCWDRLGEAEMFLCRFDDAKEAFRRVVEIGGFTKLNAILVDSAKSSLRSLDEPTFLRAMRARWCPREDSNAEKVASGVTRFCSGFFVTRKGSNTDQRPRSRRLWEARNERWKTADCS